MYSLSEKLIINLWGVCLSCKLQSTFPSMNMPPPPSLHTQGKMLTTLWYFKLNHNCEQNPWLESYFIIYGFLLSLYFSSCSFRYIAET